MRIVALTARHLRIPLRKTIKHASHTRSDNDTLVVRCELEDGHVGWGEGLPRDYVTGETIDTALDTFTGSRLREQLADPIAALPAAIDRCNRLELVRIGEGDRDCLGNSVRCAIELAILDAVARSEGVPLSKVTPLVPETAGFRHEAENVFYSGVVTSLNWFKEYVRAYKMRLNAFRQVKVKVGVAGDDDAATLRRIRWLLGPHVDIRLDANEAWNADEIADRMKPLEPFGISSLEQPVPHAQVDRLPAVREQIDTPLMLDESLCSEGDAHRAVERGLCDLFNVRLSKCGGLLSSLRIAAIAHRAGLGYQLGCQVGETGILSAAGRHFATSVDGIRFLEGSFDRYLVRERLTVEDLTFGFRGRAPALTGPGLGVTIDEAAVERASVAERTW
jgi:L-Ala-D/L-Glu epimerase